MPTFHYYSFVFLRAYGQTTQHHGAIVGLPHKRVTNFAIEHARQISEAPAGSLMLSVSYLGEMTEAEYKGAAL